jgi:hypothetical protein
VFFCVLIALRTGDVNQDREIGVTAATLLCATLAWRGFHIGASPGGGEPGSCDDLGKGIIPRRQARDVGQIAVLCWPVAVLLMQVRPECLVLRVEGKMDVLVSWSGQQSRQVGSALYEWLKEVIPGINPWISTVDIAIGTSWFESLMTQLDSTSLCVICMTPENVRSPWLYFEAGAIAGKRADARVCSYLIGVSGNQLMAGPLAQFQWAEANKAGTWKLIREINRCLSSPHNEPLLENGFDRKWPLLKRRLEKAVAEYDPAITGATVETEEQKSVYRLSPESEQLLVEAAADPQGVVLMVRTTEGLHIQTNRKQLGESGNPRSEATWQGAVRELLQNDLLQTRGSKGEVFGVTAEGYRVADELRTKKVAGTT